MKKTISWLLIVALTIVGSISIASHEHTMAIQWFADFVFYGMPVIGIAIWAFAGNNDDNEKW